MAFSEAIEDDKPASAAETVDRFASGKLRACQLCSSKKKRCTHRGGDHGVVGETDLTMNTRLRKREQGEASVRETQPHFPSLFSLKFPKLTLIKVTDTSHAKSPSSPASTSSTTDTNEMEKFNGRHKRSVSVKSARKNAESTAPAKTATTKTTRATNGETAASNATVPEPPTDMLRGSIALSVHSVYAHELQQRLDDFEAKFEASMAAHEATKEAAQAVRETVHGWVDAWTSGR
ncbi:uncharacterized protein N7498_008314 [Penicillium cinerascens]|uniref:Uncharacterized protein n=1 Tax=Penicillium cinerascens TaxID=70096 RepID=A0A9W9M9K1_9EURO|nr:uncharacterized protein N7498_008314 [Penicillium cinerascens]KAJ5194876.1 hypothetical protein N7498_008314 [Penicillium cinerascens]